MNAYTFDTGALIALERNRQRMVSILRQARADGIRIVVPSVCIAEWWRGRTDVRERILGFVIIEHTDDQLVKLTGVALALVPKATCIDAMVMASAARDGGVVFTTDVDDLLHLQTAFPSVRVLGV